MEKNERRFFVLSSEAIDALQDELYGVIGDELTRRVLYNFGFKSGYTASHGVEIEGGPKNPADYIYELWMQMGVARPTAIEVQGTSIRLTVRETIESGDGKNNCDFTRGFLAGLVTYIKGTLYRCEEDRCVSSGDEKYVFTAVQDEETDGES